jgi:hypothetical protein
VPELPATKLDDYCYLEMFCNCTSLTTVPALPATTLKYCCYADMFRGCANLAALPALPATKLAEGCYFRMFHTCEKIVISPQKTTTCYNAYRIPSTGTASSIGEGALDNMFYPMIDMIDANTTYYVNVSVIS